MKFFDKQKDFIGKLKNKQKEKSVPNNGVDDTNEFRSLKPFYENLTKKKLLEEYYDPNKIFWKDIKFGSFPIPSLDNMSNRTEYQNLKNKLYADAIQSINSEQDKQNKRVCYDDERELRFLLKYSRDVENGVRHDELEPEWQWAADISIVYTWVNGSDPIHLEQKAKYNGGIKKADNRDRSVDELRFSLRSLFKYLPWHKGTIFIVTPGQTPEWLDTEFDRIKIINQEDILPKKDMNGNDVNPTFNSFAIEWYLDRIPGLTEQFIQLNDDYFFNQPVHPSYFFYGSGESYDIDEEYIMYFNKEQELKKSFPYFYYKFYKHSDQYKMTSKLTYYKYLNNKHLVSDFSPCIQELLAYLKSKAPYEFINMHHSRCITKALIEINKYYNSNENKASTNTTTTTTTKATSATLNSINEDKKDEKINTESIFEIERIKNNNKDNNVSESKEKEENIEEIEEEELNHSKKKRYEYKPKDKEIFFPNAAQHFRFPNFFLALHFLINDIQYAKNVGRKSFSQTTMSERFVASLAMTNGAIKSLYGRYIRTNQLEHSPYVWYRDLFPMSREKFKNYIDITLTHKFRHPEDVIPPFANQAFIRYTASKKGFEELFDKFYSSKYIHDLDEEATGDYNNKVINRNRTILKYGFHIVEDHLREKTMRFGQIFDDATRNIKLYSDIIKEPYLFFNFNDDYNEPRVSQELHEIMEYLFPDKGVFEK
ncbi:hypothetical protein BCR36DRAFT_345229 [Piromyces finnis]|uniref:Stealth protein CR2 conserved region 2 domain-containing protein n=1 Tax=Piromyces finnis TaxID=1754191 RepID=A0A1Y1VIR5_9FUNG|nr:hypothetical protein BCR36DRAFT_345229 [Piromyces finnis]|eukprot:ORX57228.1 hypothetical protein BCR36DRAFT_345229 [Piromyces finnis]